MQKAKSDAEGEEWNAKQNMKQMNSEDEDEDMKQRQVRSRQVTSQLQRLRRE
jgi:hypothetical protein